MGATQASHSLRGPGVVYDVSSRPDLYAARGTYHRLAGRDATRAVVSMTMDDVDQPPLNRSAALCPPSPLDELTASSLHGM